MMSRSSSMLGRCCLYFPAECSLNFISRVQEVKDDRVILSIKNPNNKDAKPEIKELEAGFVLWSTGIGKLLSMEVQRD